MARELGSGRFCEPSAPVAKICRKPAVFGLDEAIGHVEVV